MSKTIENQEYAIKQNALNDRVQCFRKCLQILYLFDTYKRDPQYAHELGYQQQSLNQSAISAGSDAVSLKIYSSNEINQRQSPYVIYNTQNRFAFESIQQKPQRQEQRINNENLRIWNKTPNFKQNKFNTLGSQYNNHVKKKDQMEKTTKLQFTQTKKNLVKKHDCLTKPVQTNKKKTRLQQIMSIKVKKPQYNNNKNNIDLCVQRVIQPQVASLANTKTLFESKNRYQQCRNICSQICKNFSKTLALNQKRNNEIYAKYEQINSK